MSGLVDASLFPGQQRSLMKMELFWIRALKRPYRNFLPILLPGVKEIDRTGVNSWEDEEFRNAIRKSGRKKVVIAGLWTEVCLTFPTLDMLAEGYEVYPVADAVGGISPVSHTRAFDRMIQAGAQPVTAVSFGSELMRNWARPSSDKFRQVLRWYFPKRVELKKAGKL